jgi:uncharacterized protein YqgC (DUF456 family)
MTTFLQVCQSAGYVLAMVGVACLCIVGIVMSCLSLSGTWVVLAATVIAALVDRDPFPGWVTILVFAGVAVLVEVAEGLAGTWGVKRRGGSWAAGAAAAVGGLLGFVLGSLVPVPLVGGLVGMVALSFALVYVVERRRLRHSEQAANIAWGAVVSRILVIFLKVAVTVGMAAVLWVGILAGD